jgi:hypothetical protein
LATSNLAVQNFFETTLSSSISASDTTISLNSVPTGSEGFLIIEPDNITSREVIYFTSKTVSAVVCPSVGAGRGQDGTSASSHASGSVVRMTLTKGHFDGLKDGSAMSTDHQKNIIPYAPQGYLQNGKIVTSVATNDLTVAIKTLAGNDPSASDPVYVRIGDTVRAITTATSKTLNDGTNWFNSGSTSLATFEVDYFCYLIWNTTPATDRVDIGFARIPHGRTYADFSGTTTNEKYLAFSGADTPASTDEVEVVGRFNATLSATAAFNWSIPATSVIVNRPITETRRLSFNSNPSGITIGNGNGNSFYKIVNQRLTGQAIFNHGTTSSMTTTPTFALPLSVNSNVTAESVIGRTAFVDAGTTIFYGNTALSTASTITPWIGSVGGTYETRVNLSTTIPMTWANSDAIISDFEADM